MRDFMSMTGFVRWYRDNHIYGTLEQKFKLWRKAIGEKA